MQRVRRPAEAVDGIRKERISDAQSARDEPGVGTGIRRAVMLEVRAGRRPARRQGRTVEGRDQRRRQIGIEALVGWFAGGRLLPRLLVDGNFDRDRAAGRPLTAGRCTPIGGEAVGFAGGIVATAIVVNDRIHHRTGIRHLCLQRADGKQPKQQERAQK
jgi:hypothetical protein